jgi:hypothetical protein
MARFALSSVSDAGVLAMRLPLVLFAAAALIGTPALAAAPKHDDLATFTTGLVAGTPVSCIQLSLSRESRTFPHQTIAYRSGAAWYVANFQDGCDSLDWSSTVVTRTPSDQLCRGDIAELQDNTTHMYRGSCVFANFTPYTKPKVQRP